MKSVDFDHKGRAYSLRFDFNAMARYEREMRETISQFLGGSEGRGDVDVARTIAIIWASLNRRLPIEQVGDMVGEMGFNAATSLAVQSVNQAIELLNSDPNLPKTDDGAEAGNAKKAD